MKTTRYIAVLYVLLTMVLGALLLSLPSSTNAQIITEILRAQPSTLGKEGPQYEPAYQTVKGAGGGTNSPHQSVNDPTGMLVGWDFDEICDIVGKALKVPRDICTIVVQCIIVKVDDSGKRQSCPLTNCWKAMKDVFQGDRMMVPDGAATPIVDASTGEVTGYDQKYKKDPNPNDPSTRREIKNVARACKMLCSLLPKAAACKGLLDCVDGLIALKPDDCKKECDSNASKIDEAEITTCQTDRISSIRKKMAEQREKYEKIYCGSYPAQLGTDGKCAASPASGKCSYNDCKKFKDAYDSYRLTLEYNKVSETGDCTLGTGPCKDALDVSEIRACGFTTQQCKNSCDRNKAKFGPGCCDAMDLVKSDITTRFKTACAAYQNAKMCVDQLKSMSCVNTTPNDGQGMFDNFRPSDCIPSPQCCKVADGWKAFSDNPLNPNDPKARDAALVGNICRATIDVWQCASDLHAGLAQGSNWTVNMSPDCCQIIDIMQYSGALKGNDLRNAKKYCLALVDIGTCINKFRTYKAGVADCEKACDEGEQNAMNDAQKQGLDASQVCDKDAMKKYAEKAKDNDTIIGKALAEETECDQKIQNMISQRSQKIFAQYQLVASLQAADPNVNVKDDAGYKQIADEIQDLTERLEIQNRECDQARQAVLTARANTRVLAANACHGNWNNCRKNCKYNPEAVSAECCSAFDIMNFLPDQQQYKQLCGALLDTAVCVKNIKYGDGTKKADGTPRVPAIDDRCCSLIETIEQQQQCPGGATGNSGCANAKQDMQFAVNACRAGVSTYQCIEEYTQINLSNNKNKKRMSAKCCAAADLLPNPHRSNIRAACMSVVNANNCYQSYIGDVYKNDTLGTDHVSAIPDGEEDHVLTTACCDALGQFPESRAMTALNQACKAGLDVNECLFGPRGFFGRKKAIAACMDSTQGGCPQGSAGNAQQYIDECVDICLKEIGRDRESPSAVGCTAKCKKIAAGMKPDEDDADTCKADYCDMDDKGQTDTSSKRCYDVNRQPVNCESADKVYDQCSQQSDTAAFSVKAHYCREAEKENSNRAPGVRYVELIGSRKEDQGALNAKNADTVCEYNCVKKYKFIPYSCCNAMDKIGAFLDTTNGTAQNPNLASEKFGKDDMQVLASMCRASVSAVTCTKGLLSHPPVITRECCGLLNAIPKMDPQTRQIGIQMCAMVVDLVQCVKGIDLSPPDFPTQCCQALDSGLMLTEFVKQKAGGDATRDANNDGVPDGIEFREQARGICYAAVSSVDCINTFTASLKNMKDCKKQQFAACNARFSISGDEGKAFQQCQTDNASDCTPEKKSGVNQGGKIVYPGCPDTSVNCCYGEWGTSTGAPARGPCYDSYMALQKAIGSCNNAAIVTNCTQNVSAVSEQCCQAASQWLDFERTPESMQQKRNFQRYCALGVDVLNCARQAVTGTVPKNCCTIINQVPDPTTRQKMITVCEASLQCVSKMKQNFAKNGDTVAKKYAYIPEPECCGVLKAMPDVDFSATGVSRDEMINGCAAGMECLKKYMAQTDADKKNWAPPPACCVALKDFAGNLRQDPNVRGLLDQCQRIFGCGAYFSGTATQEQQAMCCQLMDAAPGIRCNVTSCSKPPFTEKVPIGKDGQFVCSCPGGNDPISVNGRWECPGLTSGGS